MPKLPDNETTYEVVCPHCRKSFEAPLLTGGAPRYQGFKCPHCRLFISYDRVEEQAQISPRAS
jgi:transposase-like protein